MSRTSRVTKLEQVRAVAKNAVTRIERVSVAPSPNGPVYTGRVFIHDLETGTSWAEERPEIAGTPATGAQRYAKQPA